ncbi:MAG TPA: S41 family peptidase [Ohtaekwangia sp.]
MRKKIKWIVVLLVVAVGSLAFRKPVEKYFDIAKSLDIFATLFKEINAYYVDDVEPEKLVRKGIDGMLESLDPYTDFIPEDEIESFRISTTGQYGGIGALIGIVNKKTVVTNPYKGFPAYRSGIKVGDEIIAVDGKNIQGKSTSEVSAMLKGQPRTEVEIKIRRIGVHEDLKFLIKREKISINNLSYFGLVDEKNAYLRLNDFTPGASREVASALMELKEQGATKLILDLRDNPGGLLHEAVNIVSLFIPRGQEVVSTKGKVDEWNKSYNTLNAPIDTEIPIVVLVNDGSASASEIVAGALQDYDRAVLVGNKTFGKGLVQTTRPLAYNAQLKVTTAKYYIPSGRCIQAMDYTHRKDDGTVERIADSLKVEFKTKHGRKVYDGGGLDPDIKVDDDYIGTLSSALVSSGLVFDFASLYCAENPVKPDLKTFHIGDKDYERFLSRLREQKFSYVTPLERSSRQLMETAKKERYYADLEPQLSSLKSKIDASKAGDFVRFRNEISRILEEQIAFHYAQSEGQVEISLQQDKTVLEALKILRTPEAYSKILSPQ